MAARFEIVQTDAEQPWHSRFVAANGEVVWSSENYADVRDAENAITLLAEAFGAEALPVEVRSIDLTTEGGAE